MSVDQDTVSCPDLARVRARRAGSASTWTVEAEFAAEFVKEWEAAWNSHDLDRVLSHYSEDVVFQSPYVVQRLGEPSGEVRGKEALRAYWASGLQAQPTFASPWMTCGSRSTPSSSTTGTSAVTRSPRC